jgi:hypothetical protein
VSVKKKPQGDPDRYRDCRVAGLLFGFEYHFDARDVLVGPDEQDLAGATPGELSEAWATLAWWAHRFLLANPGWTVNGDGEPKPV